MRRGRKRGGEWKRRSVRWWVDGGRVEVVGGGFGEVGVGGGGE